MLFPSIGVNFLLVVLQLFQVTLILPLLFLKVIGENEATGLNSFFSLLR